MSKLKSKKMTKSTFAIIIMAIAMIAMIAFGGTYAYFTASSQVNNATITVGKIQLKNAASAKMETKTVMPKQEMFGANAIAFSTDGSTEASYVAVKVSIEIDSTFYAISELAGFGFTFAYDDSKWEAVEDKTDGAEYTAFVYTATNFLAEQGKDYVLNTAPIVFDAKENNDNGESTLTFMGKQIKFVIQGFSLQSSVLSEEGGELVSPTAQKVWNAINGYYTENKTAEEA